MTESAGSKSDSFRKTKPMTREDKLALGEPPTVHLGQWLGRDPRTDFRMHASETRERQGLVRLSCL